MTELIIGGVMALAFLLKGKKPTEATLVNNNTNTGSGTGTGTGTDTGWQWDGGSYVPDSNSTGGDPNEILYGGEITITGTQKSYIQKGVAYPMNRVNFSVSGEFTTEASTAVPTSDFMQKTSNGVVWYGAKGNRNMNSPSIEIFVGHYDLQGVFVKDAVKTVTQF